MDDSVNILYDDNQSQVIEILSADGIKKYAPEWVKEPLVSDWANRYRYGDLYLIILKTDPIDSFYIFKDKKGKVTYYNNEFDDVTKSEFELELPDYVKNETINNIINGIDEGGEIYRALVEISKGKEYDVYKLGNIDSLISGFRFSKNNPAKSMISLTFDSNKDYLELFSEDLSEEDIWMGNSLFSYYGTNYEFFDSYRAEQDWYEGYVFAYFNEENTEKLKNILKRISPKFWKFETSEDTEGAAKFLYSTYNREIDYIISDYATEVDSAMANSIKQDIKSELSDVLIDIGIIEKSFMYKYYTTVKVLLNLYKRNNDKTLNIYDTLKKVISENISVNGNFSESSYEFNYNDFDGESFNRSVGNQLDKIIDKLDEDSDKNEYYGLMNQILDKYDIDKWYPLNRDENKHFAIEEINPETLKITIVIHDKKSLKVERRSLSLEEFNNFIHNYELFTESRKKK
jgi:hypothetical protein